MSEILKDRASEAQVFISSVHNHIHEGRYFTCSGRKTALAAAASFDILFTFPPGVIGHLTTGEFTFDEGPVDLKFYENVTTTSDGTAANVRNHNRISRQDTAGAVITVAPVAPVVSVDNLLFDKYYPALGNKQGLMVSDADSEWIIGAISVEQKYLWRITNNNNGAITIGYEFAGYEL